MSGKSAPVAPIEFFLKPLPVLAVIVLFVNDHHLKAKYANWLTGKISDFAGLFFFPLFALCMIFIFGHLVGRRWKLTHLNLLIAIGLTHSAFALIKLWPPATDLYITVHRALGVNSQVIRDPTDLWALLMAPVTYWYGRSFFTAPSDRLST